MANLTEYRADIAGGAVVYVKPSESFAHARRRALANNRPYFSPYMMRLNPAYDSHRALFVDFLSPLSLMKTALARQLRYDDMYVGNYLREETDFYFRARQQGARIIYCSHTTAYHMPVSRHGGCRHASLWKYQLYAIRNNYLFSRRHFKAIQAMGVRSGFVLFNLLHVLNRVRLVVKGCFTYR